MVSVLLTRLNLLGFRSQLTNLVFGFVRDGYYSELRRLRRVSNVTMGPAKEMEKISNREESVSSESEKTGTRWVFQST